MCAIPAAAVAKLAIFKERAVFSLPGKSVRPVAVWATCLRTPKIRMLSSQGKKTGKMKQGNDTHVDLWERLGALEDDQAFQVLTQLFSRFETRRNTNPADPASTLFFDNLASVIDQVQSCNINRR